MSITLRHLLALATAGTVAAALALSGAGAASGATAPSTTTDPAAAAAGWLAQQFVGADHKAAPAGDHFDGSFPGSGGKTSYFFDGGTTADAVFALAAAKVGSAKIDAAMSYFAKHVAEYTSITDTSGAPGPSDGQIGKTALAVIVAGEDPTHFGGYNLLATLKADECTTESGSSSDFTVPTCPAAGAGRNIFSSVSESLIVLAEARAGGASAPSPAAVSYFLSLQCPNGGFTGLTAACTKNSDASPDETAYASMALAALGGHSAELSRADKWLVQDRRAGGYWVAQGGPDVDSTALAAAALRSAGEDVSASRSWLLTQQVRTGPTVGTGASRGALKFQGAFDATSSVKATADGVLGLARQGSLATLTDAGAAASAPVLAPATPTFKTSSVRQGGTQTVTGTGFSAGERVSGVLHSAPVAIGGVTASKAGTVALTFTVPAKLAVGTHTVVLTGATSGLSATSATFRVSARPAATASATTPTRTGPELAATGLDGRQALDEGLLGAVLVLLGAGAVYAGRRRRA